ncbi:hypothetical protein, partial [Aggregatibacter actinomycetemcomitans]|uniref:hypothetical protein n=1 Tax=Aggregatibacter actinomycetemcomitans TaxID=714 RepID=UPI001E6529D6
RQRAARGQPKAEQQSKVFHYFATNGFSVFRVSPATMEQRLPAKEINYSHKSPHHIVPFGFSELT